MHKHFNKLPLLIGVYIFTSCLSFSAAEKMVKVMMNEGQEQYADLIQKNITSYLDKFQKDLHALKDEDFEMIVRKTQADNPQLSSIYLSYKEGNIVVAEVYPGEKINETNIVIKNDPTLLGPIVNKISIYQVLEDNGFKQDSYYSDHDAKKIELLLDGIYSSQTLKLYDSMSEIKVKVEIQRFADSFTRGNYNVLYISIDGKSSSYIGRSNIKLQGVSKQNIQPLLNSIFPWYRNILDNFLNTTNYCDCNSLNITAAVNAFYAERFYDACFVKSILFENGNIYLNIYEGQKSELTFQIIEVKDKLSTALTNNEKIKVNNLIKKWMALESSTLLSQANAVVEAIKSLLNSQNRALSSCEFSSKYFPVDKKTIFYFRIVPGLYEPKVSNIIILGNVRLNVIDRRIKQKVGRIFSHKLLKDSTRCINEMPSIKSADSYTVSDENGNIVIYYLITAHETVNLRNCPLSANLGWQGYKIRANYNDYNFLQTYIPMFIQWEPVLKALSAEAIVSTINKLIYEPSSIKFSLKSLGELGTLKIGTTLFIHPEYRTGIDVKTNPIKGIFKENVLSFSQSLPSKTCLLIRLDTVKTSLKRASLSLQKEISKITRNKISQRYEGAESKLNATYSFTNKSITLNGLLLAMIPSWRFNSFLSSVLLTFLDCETYYTTNHSAVLSTQNITSSWYREESEPQSNSFILKCNGGKIASLSGGWTSLNELVDDRVSPEPVDEYLGSSTYIGASLQCLLPLNIFAKSPYEFFSTKKFQLSSNNSLFILGSFSFSYYGNDFFHSIPESLRSKGIFIQRSLRGNLSINYNLPNILFLGNFCLSFGWRPYNSFSYNLPDEFAKSNLEIVNNSWFIVLKTIQY